MTRKKLLIVITVITVGVLLTVGIVTAFRSADDRTTQLQDEKATYLVTFYSDDGTVLKIDSVQENGVADPPNNLELTYGKIFQHWDNDLENITKNIDVYPVCQTINDLPNAFAIESVYTQNGEKIVVSLVLGGEVCVAGFDIIIYYNAQALQLESVLEDGAIIYNADVSGQIRMNYVSLENTYADVDVCKLTFCVSAECGTYPITVEVMSICACNDTLESMDDTLYVPDYHIFNGAVYILP